MSGALAKKKKKSNKQVPVIVELDGKDIGGLLYSFYFCLSLSILVI
jgi:hypothetical protein